MADFACIVGQDQAVALLQRSLDSGIISHAYLFMGPPGVGKQMTAQAFARSLLQQEDPGAEVYLREGIHPDLMEISLPENRTRISKEQISQEMIPWLAMKPYRARHRIVLIHDSHLMSLEAANALLKTLEEPPEYALIILLSDTAEILETIVSRCQLVQFYPLGVEAIQSVLLSRGIEPEVASRAARLSQGSLGEALQFCEEQDWPGRWQQALSLLQGLSSGEPIKVFEAASLMEEDLELNVRLVETIIRDRLILQYSDQDNLLLFPENKDLYRQLPPLHPEQVLRGWERINRIKRYSRYHVNRSLIAVNIAYEWLHLLQPQVSPGQGAHGQRR
ncbi:MAG TPA: DNA polymerase III subunit [Syntrophomonadaceae bacterium]|nr:DNA polymerase III subunit [Syntrophomonadaceae bacterium]HOQ10123.1 DNA polymerase III subunit [Syntrophomonadaceae bacterium]HPU49256.1 DNA polymerase III subunit [Syntrophomonadaceae bacterium]